MACPVFLSSFFESCADPGYLPLNWWLASFGAMFEYFLYKRIDWNGGLNKVGMQQPAQYSDRQGSTVLTG